MKRIKWFIFTFTFYYRWNRLKLSRFGSFKRAIYLMRQPLPF